MLPRTVEPYPCGFFVPDDHSENLNQIESTLLRNAVMITAINAFRHLRSTIYLLDYGGH